MESHGFCQSLIMNSIRAQKHVLSDSPYCTVNIHSERDIPVLCYSSSRKTKRNAVIYSPDEGFRNATYNGSIKSVMNEGNPISESELMSDVKTDCWKREDNASLDRERLAEIGELSEGDVHSLINLLDDFSNQVAQNSNTRDFTFVVTIWDDGTFRFKAHSEIDVQIAKELGRIQDSQAEHYGVYEQFSYKWSDTSIKHQLKVGNLENNYLVDERCIDTVEFDSFDYLEKARSKKSILL